MTCMIMMGDCRQRMAELPAGYAQTCVTSPPYFGLRDYGQDGQLGLEPTPDEFVAALVEVFREVWRVLADDGTVWLNLGDSYARAGGWSNNNGLDGVKRGEGNRARSNMTGRGGQSQKLAPGLKDKDLIGIPWRVAFALQADGWYLRQDIIWHKPNPMPESVTDRCTKAHEYIFLLSKGPRYYFDADAIKEPCAPDSLSRNKRHKSVGNVPDRVDAGGFAGTPLNGMRNKRDVWTVSTKPYRDAHFATFPPDLIEPCILAGAPVGGMVLDPFGGAGTTGLVAERHGRHSVLTELNPAYAALAAERIGTEAVIV